MAYLILGLFLAVALLLLLQWWANAETKAAKKAFLVAIGVFLAIISVALIAAGKAFLAVFPIGLSLWRILGPTAASFFGRKAKKAFDNRHNANQSHGNENQRSHMGRNQSASMTRDEAREVLGVSKEASEEEILKAYRRLIASAQPDKGGSDWMAAKINQAKDTLLKK